MTRDEMFAANAVEGADRQAVHRQYYAQYVTDALRNLAAQKLDLGAVGRAIESGDPHLNGIRPLAWWDQNFLPAIVRQCSAKARELGDVCCITPATAVCIAKEAARQAWERAA